ncbi:MAG: tRNA-dihydrouridine synthase [Planctomycetaceae bacterium]|nr:tRNA-dihydrouridine synthase [Planctomycetaceae bacterium]
MPHGNADNRPTLRQLAGPIEIGGRPIPTRYFLAPLAGYTHLAFRRVLRRLGGLGLATTDLVQATMLVSETRKSLELVETCEEDRPLSVQIFSGVTDHLVDAARWLNDRGYQGIDINMGCPMAKVNGTGGGARLMCNVDGAVEAAARVIDAVHIPVTVKMRLGWDDDNLTAPQLAAELEQVGVAAITVHGRTRAQGFHGAVNRRAIKDVVAAVTSIPVIANGDIRTVNDALSMFSETGCDGIAIGRGAMLDPWLFRRIDRVMNGLANLDGSDAQKGNDSLNQIVREQQEWTPGVDEQLDFLSRHFRMMVEQHAEFSCLLFRKFAAWYGVRLGIPDDLEARLRRFESYKEFDEIISQIRLRHGEREVSVPTALIKVPNGPVSHW